MDVHFALRKRKAAAAQFYQTDLRLGDILKLLGDCRQLYSCFSAALIFGTFTKSPSLSGTSAINDSLRNE